MELNIKKSPITISFFLFISVFIVYLLTMPTKIADNSDAIDEVHWATDFVRLLRPQHLFLTTTLHLVGRINEILGLQIPLFLSLQVFTSLVGSLSIALFFIFLKNVGIPTRVSIFACFVLAFSYVHWLHSREVESAILSQFFVISTLLYLSALRLYQSNRATWLLTFLAMFTTVLSILYALNCAMLFPAYCILLVNYGQNNGKKKQILFYVIGSILLPLFILGFASFTKIGHFSVTEFVTWFSSHPSIRGFSPELQKFSLTNILRAESGLLNAFIGHTDVTTWIKLLIHKQSGLAIAKMEIVKFFIGLLIIFYVHFVFFQFPRNRFSRTIYFSNLAGIVGILGFNVFWLGSDPQFSLSAIPFLVTQSCLVVAENYYVSSIKYYWYFIPLPIFSSFLLICNFFYPVPTFTLKEGGEDWKKMEFFQAHTSSADILIHISEWGNYLSFFNRNSSRLIVSCGSHQNDFLNELSKDLDDSLKRGAKVYLEEILSTNYFNSLNEWTNFKDLTGMNQDSVARYLSKRYDTSVVFAEQFGNSIVEIKRKY